MSNPAIYSPRIALVGNPNCGKTALFNRLTGARQKVANYAGVTIERKEGQFRAENGRVWHVLDLPGTYSLNAATPDEKITEEVINGSRADAPLPDIVICVVDACNLKRGLRVALELKAMQFPFVLAVNMMDVANKRGIQIDIAKLGQELNCEVVETIAIKRDGVRRLLDSLDKIAPTISASTRQERPIPNFIPEQIHHEVNRILAICVQDHERHDIDFERLSDRVDRWLLHPVSGTLFFTLLMFMVFQAVFSWAQLPMDAIKAGVDIISQFTSNLLPDGILKSLIVEGIIAGTGSVLVFLPQILILFFFILLLEDSGYLPRAAYLLDRMMGKVGLSGRAFIPLLSSFACAIPGIMATRTIQNSRDRLVTIMIAPLMTCSARLPVYALIIAAFIPSSTIAGLSLQGLVLFSLYAAGILAAMAVAFVFKRVWKQVPEAQALLLELPEYRLPNPMNLLLGLWERGRIFIARVGTIILSLMILLWFLSNFPGAPEGATQPAIYYSVAGYIGRGLEFIFAPIGFNWQICIALIPGLAAREVAVAALGTVYSISASGDDLHAALEPLLSNSWSLSTALSLLAWYVFAPQCLATLSVVKRETNTWRYPLMMAGYLFGLAYLASLITYQVSRFLGFGS